MYDHKTGLNDKQKYLLWALGGRLIFDENGNPIASLGVPEELSKIPEGAFKMNWATAFGQDGEFYLMRRVQGEIEEYVNSVNRSRLIHDINSPGREMIEKNTQTFGYIDENGNEVIYRIFGALMGIDREKINQALIYRPITKEEALAMGAVEGRDFFMIDWASEAKDCKPQLQNDPVSVANVTPHLAEKKLYSSDEEKLKRQLAGLPLTEKYIKSIDVTTTATFLVEAHVKLTIPEAGITIDHQRNFVINVTRSFNGLAGGEEFKEGQEKAVLEKWRGFIEGIFKGYQSLASLGSGDIQGEGAGKGLQEAYFPNETIGSSGNDYASGDDGTVGSDGDSGYGGGNYDGGSYGGGSYGGDEGSGSDSSGGSTDRGTGTPDDPIKPDNGENQYTSNETVRKLTKYFRIEGNQDGIDTDWSDASDNGQGNDGQDGGNSGSQGTNDGQNGSGKNGNDGDSEHNSNNVNGGNGTNGGNGVDGGKINGVNGIDGYFGDANSHHHITDDYHNIKGGMGSLGLPGAKITMQISGTVWNETKEIDGRINNEENILAGVQVQLIDAHTNRVVATTSTDQKGKYRFYGQITNDYAMISGLKKYYVIFTYSGQTYESTFYKDDLTGTFSNAKEINRDDYDKKFENIYSESNDYYLNANGLHADVNSQDGKGRKSYANTQRIEKDNEEYVEFDGRALTYDDVYKEFLKETMLNEAGEPNENDYNKVWNRGVSYDSVINTSLKDWLKGKGITKEYETIRHYIYDTFIQSTTRQENSVYPKFNQFVIKEIDNRDADQKQVTLDKKFTYLYSKNSDQSRNVNYGLWTRPASDLALQKDIYKTTLVVNGKKEVYTYDKKSVKINDFWDTGNRTGSELYNERNETDGKYIREIRKSDYLYNGNDAYGKDPINNVDNNAKNLQAFVTYKIAVRNQGNYDTKINEIVDYYDANTYEFDGQLDGNQYKIKQRDYSGNVNEGGHEDRMPGQQGENYVYSYVGQDANGTKQSDLTVKTQGINRNEHENIKGEKYNYETLYLTGIKGERGQEKLLPGETAYVYVTYKVKNDQATNRIIMDQNLGDSKGGLLLGKKGIAEVNSYSTYYGDRLAVVPNEIINGQLVGTLVKGNTAGKVDVDSNPGSLKSKDLDSNGNIKTSKNLKDDRQQDDCDKSSNMNLIIDANEDNNRVRKFSGAVFEDERTENSEKAVVGDGKEKGETRINGVTLQLVELVRNVNADGVFQGTYAGEKIWGNYTYQDNVNGSKELPRYASGSDRSSVVISGNGLLKVEPDPLTANNGEYSFKSIPAGDFYIRFIYGDTAETTMIDFSKWQARYDELDKKVKARIASYEESTEYERLDNIKDINQRFVGTIEDYQGNQLSGRNAKSYNGQDYKSTTYQSGNVDQSGNYYGINGFNEYDKQNFYIVDDLKLNKEGTGTRADVVYKSPNVDKSKLYYYNINVGDNNPTVSDAKDVYDYRINVNNWSRGANGSSLTNDRAEVLSSFEKKLTYWKEDKNNRDSQYNEDEMKQKQRDALVELMDNTYMVAQTGLISTEIERTTQSTDVWKGGEYVENPKYLVNDLNLGLVERPKAGLKLNKEIDNFSFMNSDNRVAFNVSNNQSVAGLSFSNHEQHKVNYKSDNIMSNLRTITSATTNRLAYDAQKAPERLQLYVDPELMNPANVKIRYKYFVENIGEVDYISPTFYYTGKPAEGDTVSKTNADQVIDYVSNSITYDKSKQENNIEWEQTEINKEKTKFSLIKSSELVDKVKDKIELKNREALKAGEDYVTRYNLPKILTYNTILTTKQLSNGTSRDNGKEGLMPTKAEEGKSRVETNLTLLQDITSSNEDNLTYNNLAEIIETSNTLGRRCAYSIPGNQEIADQSLGKNAAEDQITRMKWVKPGEIDADSAQTIVIMPPTGEVDYTIYIILGLAGVAIICFLGITLKFTLSRRKKKILNK